MEPMSAIAISLALGAVVAAGKEVVSALVKDAYGKLRGAGQEPLSKSGIIWTRHRSPMRGGPAWRRS